METSELIIAKKHYSELSELYENYWNVRFHVESLEQETSLKQDKKMFNALNYVERFIYKQLNEVSQKFRG